MSDVLPSLSLPVSIEDVGGKHVARLEFSDGCISQLIGEPSENVDLAIESLRQRLIGQLRWHPGVSVPHGN